LTREKMMLFKRNDDGSLTEWNYDPHEYPDHDIEDHLVGGRLIVSGNYGTDDMQGQVGLDLEITPGNPLITIKDQSFSQKDLFEVAALLQLLAFQIGVNRDE
jgi:hypothetical protein